MAAETTEGGAAGTVALGLEGMAAALFGLSASPTTASHSASTRAQAAAQKLAAKAAAKKLPARGAVSTTEGTTAPAGRTAARAATGMGSHAPMRQAAPPAASAGLAQSVDPAGSVGPANSLGPAGSVDQAAGVGTAACVAAAPSVAPAVAPHPAAAVPASVGQARRGHAPLPQPNPPGAPPGDGCYGNRRRRRRRRRVQAVLRRCTFGCRQTRPRGWQRPRPVRRPVRPRACSAHAHQMAVVATEEEEEERQAPIKSDPKDLELLPFLRLTLCTRAPVPCVHLRTSCFHSFARPFARMRLSLLCACLIGRNEDASRFNPLATTSAHVSVARTPGPCCDYTCMLQQHGHHCSAGGTQTELQHEW
eukprot:351836-Chlamydomonas_euryale.AAC.2